MFQLVNYPPKLNAYQLIIIISKLISPLYFSRVALLLLEAVFRVISDIIISLPSQDINIGVLRIVDTLIKGLAYSVALFVLTYAFSDFDSRQSRPNDKSCILDNNTCGS